MVLLEALLLAASGSSLSQAVSDGFNGGIIGGVSGSAAAIGMSFIEARKYDVNPWTGRLNAAKQELQPITSNTNKDDILQPDFSTSKGEITDRKGVANGIINNSDYERALSEWNRIKANLPPNAEVSNDGNAFKVFYSNGSIMIGSFYPKIISGQIQWNIHTYFTSPTSNLQLYQLKLRFTTEK